MYVMYSSLGIAPTRNPLRIGLAVAGGGFYSYYIAQGIKSDRERKIVRKIVLFKSIRNSKRRNKGNFTLKSNSNKIKFVGVGSIIILI